VSQPAGARVVVDVMPKAEILDPQGQAILKALARLGFDSVTAVRQGKRFEVDVAGPVDEAALRRMAETLLANTVIEEFTVRVEHAP
jgi:phosphoribosylformylglycinamidine synthase subunit PurS